MTVAQQLGDGLLIGLVFCGLLRALLWLDRDNKR